MTNKAEVRRSISRETGDYSAHRCYLFGKSVWRDHVNLWSLGFSVDAARAGSNGFLRESISHTKKLRTSRANPFRSLIPL
jgi:hypothetical protein